MAASAAALSAQAALGKNIGGGKTAKRPNVIYVFADQLRYSSCGFAGDLQARTPHMDQMARDGASFLNCISNTPVCCAYRSQLFTGKHTSSTGMAVNELRINPNHRCLGHVVSEAGYKTSYIGKWHLWANRHTHGRVYNSYMPPHKRHYRLGWDGQWLSSNFNHHSFHGYYVDDEPFKTMIPGYEPDWQTDRTIDYIKDNANGDKPFYLTLSYGPPHDPWTRDNVTKEALEPFLDERFPLPETWSDTPDPYMDRNTDPERWISYWKKNLEDFKRVYYAQTANLDWNLGRLMQALKDAGIEEDTILIFTSDHGEQLGANARVFKMIFYEESARLPFLIKWPKKIRKGLEMEGVFGTPDHAPTILSLMGLDTPEEMEGIDLSPGLLGKKEVRQDAVLMQGMGHTYRWMDGFEWRAARSERFTYARYRRDGSELLFDNEADPQQAKNLINEKGYRKRRNNLKEWMSEKMKSLNDTFMACSEHEKAWTNGDRVIIRSANHDWSDQPL